MLNIIFNYIVPPLFVIIESVSSVKLISKCLNIEKECNNNQKLLSEKHNTIKGIYTANNASILGTWVFLLINMIAGGKDAKVNQWCMAALSVLLIISFLMFFTYNKRSQFILIESEVNKKLENKAKECRETIETKDRVRKELAKTVPQKSTNIHKTDTTNYQKDKVSDNDFTSKAAKLGVKVDGKSTEEIAKQVLALSPKASIDALPSNLDNVTKAKYILDGCV